MISEYENKDYKKLMVECRESYKIRIIKGIVSGNSCEELIFRGIANRLSFRSVKKTPPRLADVPSLTAVPSSIPIVRRKWCFHLLLSEEDMKGPKDSSNNSLLVLSRHRHPSCQSWRPVQWDQSNLYTSCCFSVSWYFIILLFYYFIILFSSS